MSITIIPNVETILLESELQTTVITVNSPSINLSCCNECQYINEIHLPTANLKLLGNSDPSFTKITDNNNGSTGIYAQSFSATQNNEIQISESLPDKYVAGSPIYLYARIYPGSNNDGNILVDIERAFVNINSDVGNSTLSQETINIPANSMKKQLEFLLLTIPGTGLLPGAGFGIRIARRGDLSGDTHNSAIWITRFIIKHLANKP